jgi:hypothetical protein
MNISGKIFTRMPKKNVFALAMTVVLFVVYKFLGLVLLSLIIKILKSLLPVLFTQTFITFLMLIKRIKVNL